MLGPQSFIYDTGTSITAAVEPMPLDATVTGQCRERLSEDPPDQPELWRRREVTAVGGQLIPDWDDTPTFCCAPLSRVDTDNNTNPALSLAWVGYRVDLAGDRRWCSRPLTPPMSYRTPSWLMGSWWVKPWRFGDCRIPTLCSTDPLHRGGHLHDLQRRLRLQPG